MLPSPIFGKSRPSSAGVSADRRASKITIWELVKWKGSWAWFQSDRFAFIQPAFHQVNERPSKLFENLVVGWVNCAQPLSEYEIAQAVIHPGSEVIIELRLIETGLQQAAPKVVVETGILYS